METGFKPHHITASAEDLEGNQGLGRYVFLPGSDGRAASIAQRFNDLEVRKSHRGHNVYLGWLEAPDGARVDVAAVASGMGTPSLDIIVTELIKLGARRFLRVGTAGSLQPGRICAPAVVIGTGAVRDDGTSRLYAPLEFPAIASTKMVAALEQAAGPKEYLDHVFLGLIHSKDSLFARELGEGPYKAENRRYMEVLRELGVAATEMEAGHLFVLASVHGMAWQGLGRSRRDQDQVLAGSVLAVIGDDDAFASEEVAARAVDWTIDLALDGIIALAECERNSNSK